MRENMGRLIRYILIIHRLSGSSELKAARAKCKEYANSPAE